MTASTADLAFLVNTPNLNTDRATFLLNQATLLCLSVVDPLPDGADPVVLDVAARAYTNPSAQSFSPDQGSAPVLGGLWLTRENKATLRRLSSGTSGAFTIDPTPATAGAYSFWFQVPETLEDALSNVAGPFSEWDQPPSG